MRYLILLASLPGCLSTAQIIGQKIGCPTTKVQASYVGSGRYTVLCGAQAFICVSTGSDLECQQSGEVATPKVTPKPAPSSAPSSTPVVAARPVEEAPNEEEPPKSPSRAFELAIGVSLFGPPGLGVIWGPSAGHFYAGEVGHGVAMSALRLFAFVGTIAPPLLAAKGSLEPQSVFPLTLISGLLLSGLTLYDILDASEAVRRAEKAVKTRRTP